MEVTYLAGGVSNVVLLVEPGDSHSESFVLKQARGQLRVAEPWFCSTERIWREVAYLRSCERLLSPPPQVGDLTAETPRVLWEDREQYLFAMQTAPVKHTTWKERLLAGKFDERWTQLAGRLLAQLHARTWCDPATAADFAECQYFDDLRLDPYYRQVGRVRPELQAAMSRLVDSVQSHRCCLVHGDFSPKNLLVHDRGMLLIDCEVGHYGDPAFDLGFVLTHLVLKECLRDPECAGHLTLEATLPASFLAAYYDLLGKAISPEECRALEQRAIANLGGCLLARLAGKSPVEYRARLPVDRLWKLGLGWLAILDEPL